MRVISCLSKKSIILAIFDSIVGSYIVVSEENISFGLFGGSSIDWLIIIYALTSLMDWEGLITSDKGDNVSFYMDIIIIGELLWYLLP